jgi:hypothetical protein
MIPPDYTARLARLEQLTATDVAARNLDEPARHTVGALWARRAQSELTASILFAGLARDCSRSNLPAPLPELCERAVEDERFHAILSARIAEHYLGTALPELTPGPDALRFESCEAELALGLRLILHCALNETIAAVYLRECHREASSPLMRAVVRELLRDEIDHARVGWAYLASLQFELQPRLRDRFNRELPALLSLVASAWHKPLTDAEYPTGHGVLSLDETRRVAELALEALALPGLASFGIEPSRQSGPRGAVGS